MIRYSVEAALEFGAPYILFWELYCDGPKADASPPHGNKDMTGNWLIRPDESKSPAWDYFQSLLSPDAGRGTAPAAAIGLNCR